MSRLADIEARLASLEREAALLRRFGDDTRLVVGDVIRFTKMLRAVDGPVNAYSYAAIKTPKGWYTTASLARSRPSLFTYDELIQFIVQHPLAEDVEVAVSWVDVAGIQASSSGKITNDVFVSPSTAPAEPTYAASTNWGVTPAVAADVDDDIPPLPRRRVAEFGRDWLKDSVDDPELEVQTPVRDPSR